jgi:hypothetical protein
LKNDLFRAVVSAAFLCGAFSATAAAPPATEPTTYVEIWIGAQKPQSDSWKVSDPATGEPATGDLGTLPFGGGDGQLLWGTGVWQVGFEGGGVGTWKSDTTNFRGTSNGGTSVQVQLDSRFFTLGVFMGGVLSANLGHSARAYVSAGPSATWAWLDDQHNDNQNGSSNVIVLDGSKSDASFVAYGRAGFEFILDTGFAFGVSVRYADDKFDFGNGGKLQFDDPLWLLTLGARL